jgi:sialate O-acetylesterase
MLDPASNQRVLKLSGTWRFSVGDDPAWSNPDFDDKSWSRVRAPNVWEDQGYEGYNGFAWYRTRFKFPSNKGSENMSISIGRVDDVDEVFVNGVRVGGTGGFPPDYVSAWNDTRVYVIPKGALRPGKDNVVAVRVYDGGGVGGMTDGRIGIYENYVPTIAIDLAGTWKFRTGDNMAWAKEGADETDFVPIQVPGTWSQAGFGDYDGFGWYRTTFVYDNQLKEDSLVMILGQIDDLDEAYLNGQRIGGMGDLENPNGNPGVNFYREPRGYYFPSSLLKKTNTLAIRVYDQQLVGGIYSGPVGITTQAEYIAFWEARRKDSGKVRSLLDNL